MAVMVQVDGKNFNNTNSGTFCADSWDEAILIELNFCYQTFCHHPIPSQPFLGRSTLAILNRVAPIFKARLFLSRQTLCVTMDWKQPLHNFSDPYYDVLYLCIFDRLYRGLCLGYIVVQTLLSVHVLCFVLNKNTGVFAGTPLAKGRCVSANIITTVSNCQAWFYQSSRAIQQHNYI